MPKIAAIPPLALQAGRHGREVGAAGLRLRAIDGRALVSVMARKGSDDALSDVARRRFGVALPTTPVMARGPQISFVWNGHRQWLATAEEASVPDLVQALRAEFGTLASLSEQSDGRLIVEVAGSQARRMLAKLAPIDLHPRAFKLNSTALTLFGHVGAQITQVDEAPGYEVMVFRGFADSFWHALLAAGAEFGVDVSIASPAA